MWYIINRKGILRDQRGATIVFDSSGDARDFCINYLDQSDMFLQILKVPPAYSEVI